jgi:hypothetical protein
MIVKEGEDTDRPLATVCAPLIVLLMMMMMNDETMKYTQIKKSDEGWVVGGDKLDYCEDCCCKL